MTPPKVLDHSAGTEVAAGVPAGLPEVVVPPQPPSPSAAPADARSSARPGLRATVPPRRPKRRRPEVALDVKLQLRLVRLSDTAVVLSVLVAVFIVTNIGKMPEGPAEFLALRITLKNVIFLVVFALSWRLLCLTTGLYHWESIKRRRSESLRVILTCGLASAVALVFPTISITGAFRYEAVLYFWIGSSAAMVLLRNVVRSVVRVPEASRPRDALIVGGGPRGQRLERELRAAQYATYNVVGFVDTLEYRGSAADSGRFLGSLDQLESILMHSAIDEVLITLPIKSRYEEIQSVLESCQRVGVSATYLADLFDQVSGRASHDGDRPSLVMTPRAPQGWSLIAKRIIDLVGASVLLILLLPVLLLAALAIKLTSRGPVLFSQERHGLNRRRFRMYKLRTMVVDAELLQATLEAQNEASGPVFKIREDPRITAVGRFLRRSSLDEFPQLINVLRGEMSLVGPRPLPIRDVGGFTEAALMRRFSVRPGLTCLWQISGRGSLGFDDWIRLDLQYIDEWSLALDILVLLRTIPAVIRGTGAS